MSASREASREGSPSVFADLHVSSGVALAASVEHLQAQLRDVMVCYREKCKAQALEPNANIVSTLQSFPNGARLQVRVPTLNSRTRFLCCRRLVIDMHPRPSASRVKVGGCRYHERGSGTETLCSCVKR
jgi:hypothetical protein